MSRKDAWPSADLGLQVAIQRLKGLKNRPEKLTTEKIAESWKEIIEPTTKMSIFIEKSFIKLIFPVLVREGSQKKKHPFFFKWRRGGCQN